MKECGGAGSAGKVGSVRTGPRGRYHVVGTCREGALGRDVVGRGDSVALRDR